MKKIFSLLGIFTAVCAFILTCAFHVQTTRQARLIVDEEAAIGDNDDPDARLRYEWMLLRDPATNGIPRGIRQKEMEFAKDLPKKEENDNPNATWVSRGPWNVGGRTRALAVDVADANHLLAGGVSGGMWNSADGGATWTKTTAAGSFHNVTCLVQDTRAGQTSTWYYGTGERLGNSASAIGAFYVGNGIFKSDNGGASWTRLPTTNGDPQLFDQVFDIVWNVVISPTNGYVYAATFGSINRSTDGGQTWSLVLGGGTGSVGGTDIQVASDGTLYATGSSDSDMPGIWKSTTGASGSWTALTPTGGLPTSYARIVIGIAPSNANTLYFLLGPPNADNPGGHRLWKYSATTWSTGNLPALAGQTGNFDSQGSYDLLIKVKPNDENVVIIGGTNLFRSTNGFSTTGATTWIGGYTAANNSYASYPNSHADQHSFVFIPGGSVAYSGHDGGIGKTTDILASTVVWTFLNNGYLTTQCYTVALDHATSGSSSILTGLQDNGCWRVTSSVGTATWSQEFGGDGAYTAIANGGASYVVSSQNGNTYRIFGTGATDYARVDPGGTGYLFINPFVLDPNNSNLMYMSRGNTAMRNDNLTLIPPGSGDPATVGWTTLSNSSMTEPVSAIAVSKANPANRLYIGNQRGFLKRVDNANTGNPTGVETGTSLPDGNISSIAIDPTDGNKVLAVFSNYNLQSLWYTTNGGTNWTDVEGNLAGASGPSCRSATIVTSGTGTTFYLGTSVGLYSTTTLNGASTVWAQEGGSSIGNVVVAFLDSRTVDGVVVVGTHANGTYSNSGGGGGGQTTNVYSGDANNDAVCDIRDILPIGRFFASTGPPRTGGSTTWGAQTATIWNTPEATYADCDGNGTVDGNDIQGIITNYGRNRTSNDLPPPVDKVKLCYALLAELDKQPVLSSGMKSIRNAVVAYMKRELGITFDYALAQNYPNPFNPSTTIRFTIPEQTARVQIGIYNLAGQLVWSKTMADLPIGNHEAVWDGTSNTSVPVASGMYIYRITAGSFTASKRMLMIK